MFLISFRNILCPQQMFPVLRSIETIMSNNVSATLCPCLPPPLQLVALQDRFDITDITVNYSKIRVMPIYGQKVIVIRHPYTCQKSCDERRLPRFV